MSFRSELDLEDRLNKIASKAVREPVIEKSGLRAVQTSIGGTDHASIRELQLEAQLAKISTNAISDKLGHYPSFSDDAKGVKGRLKSYRPVKSEVTKEMILAYQQEMLKPVVINGKKYRYHPSSLDLDEIEYVPLHVVYTPAAIDAMKRAAAKIAGESIPRLEAEYEFYSIIEANRIREEFDREIGKIDKESFYTTTRAKKSEARELLTRQFESAMLRNDAEITRIENKIRDEEAKISAIRRRIDLNPIKILENRAEEVRVQKENALRLKAYEEDLNLLNRGKLGVTRQPNESDDEFRERLRQTGEMTVSEDEMEKSAELYNRDMLRERALELVRDTGLIGNAIKSLTAEQVFKINEKWPQIKRDFIRVYGFDNPTVRDVELIDFFKQEVTPLIDLINKGEAPPVDLLGREPEEAVPTAEVRIAEITEAQFKKKTVPQMQAWVAQNHDEFTDEFGRLKNSKDRVKFIVDKGWTTTAVTSVASPALGSSLTPIASSARRVYSLDELAEYSRAFLEKIMAREENLTRTAADTEIIRTAESKIAAIDSAAEALGSGSRDKFYAALDRLEALEPGLVTAGLPDIYPRLVGSGLKPITQDIPALIEFGKVKISPRRLYYNNVLAIKHKSGKSLAGLPNMQVSEKFVSIIMNLLRGQKPTLKDFSQLDINEKGIYDSLIQIAGLHKDIDNTFHESKQHLKKRLELVEGEIGAGNTNTALKKELHGLLGKMAHSGLIGYGDARRHYLNVTKG